MKTASDILKEHFEQLKQVVPEVYGEQRKEAEEETNEGKLFNMLKKTLSIIEAVYFQNRDMFTTTRAEEYSKIVSDLKELGFEYNGNVELIEKAANSAIMQAKLPMEKAKGSKGEDISKQAM